MVDELEERYPEFDGLNLTFETREGVLKHCSRRHAERLCQREPGGVAQRFLDRTQPSLEAQLCNIADEVAYNAHDIDDGVRSGLLTLQQLDEVELFGRHARDARTQYPDLARRRLLFESVRRMLSAQVYDIIAATRVALADARPASADAVRQARPLVGYTSAAREQGAALKRFLREKLYRHPQVVDTTERAKTVIRELFDAYLQEPSQMAPGFSARPDTVRSVVDYIAGMTDRFALKEHHRLTGRDVF